MRNQTVVSERLGRYEILAELGQGAMGVVYKAVDPVIDRTVAIKTINLNLPKDELAAFEERFYREAKSAGRLNHPNIVTIYDAGEADRVAYIAMEFLEGRELREIVASGEPLPLERVIDIATQVADGLAFAHEHGIIHRDIKPANIMVLTNGQVKITDFGIAKMSAGAHTQVGIVLGSPKYMSPEQVVGKHVDGRSDIFSLGAVLYELLTGQPAFSGEELTAIMYKVLHETPPLPTSIRPELPAALDYIVARALAKDPEARYQSAQEMAEDLRGYESLAIPALQPLLATPAVRPNTGDDTVVLGSLPVIGSARRRRRLVLAGSLALALALAVALGALVSWMMRKEPREQAPAPAPPRVVVMATQPAKTPPAAEEKKVRPAAPTARLTFAITPWGEVFVDGKRQGASPPLTELKLTPGEHYVEIRNPGFPPYTATVELKAGTPQKIRYRFKQ
jgi:predicted Ser/Thr protein kinase